VFENKVLRRIFGPQRDDVTGEWRSLHNEELYYWHSSPNIIREMKLRRIIWAGHVARMADRTGVYRISVGRHEGKRTLGRPTHRWEDNIKTDLEEVGWGGMIWIGLA
jgi:hypothetical protein